MCVRLDFGVGRNAEANGVEPWFRRVSQKYGRFNSNHPRSARTGAAGFFGSDIVRRQANLVDYRRLRHASQRQSHEQHKR